MFAPVRAKVLAQGWRPLKNCPTTNRHPGSNTLIQIRLAFAVALSLTMLAALTPLDLIGDACAQDAKAKNATAALPATPVALPDMALGPAKAPVTIVEYASISCPHCAAFEENVFPMLRTKYIDAGKVRFVFREFPLDIKAAAASVLARCIANGDAEKYFGAVQQLFKAQDRLMTQTTETLEEIGKQSGMDAQAVDACVKDQALLDKLSADKKFAYETLKVAVTPTFFINGEMVKGAMSFEELDATLKPLLKR
jgi:protein-disulfide isomerase